MALATSALALTTDKQLLLLHRLLREPRPNALQLSLPQLSMHLLMNSGSGTRISHEQILLEFHHPQRRVRQVHQIGVTLRVRRHSSAKTQEQDISDPSPKECY